MAGARDQLDEMIARLRAIPNVVEKALPEVAKECHAVIAENVAAQRGPDGTPWPKSKDGQPVLENAAQAVTAQAIGNVVLIRVSGPEARHHLGIAKGRVRRQIIPSTKLPQSMAEAIHRVLIKNLDAGLK